MTVSKEQLFLSSLRSYVPWFYKIPTPKNNLLQWFVIHRTLTLTKPFFSFILRIQVCFQKE